MGWFDEQIKLRNKKDNEVYTHTLMRIAGAVIGNKKAIDLMDEGGLEKNAVEEILKFYSITVGDPPRNIKSLEGRLDHALHPHGIFKRDVELTPGWYRDAYGPMIGFLKEDSSPIALVPYGISGYRFFDPLKGEYTRVNKDNQDRFELKAFVFYKPFPQKKLNIIDLLLYIISNLKTADYITIILTTLLATLTGMLAPRISYFLLNSVLKEKSIQPLVSTGVFLLCASVGAVLMKATKSLASARISARTGLCVEAATMMRILSLPASFFKDYGSGELSQRSSYVNQLCSSLVSVVIDTGLTSVFSLVYITQIFTYAPGLVVPALTMIIITVVFAVLSSLLQMRLLRKRMLIGTKETGLSYALISGIQKIKLSGAEMRAFSRWGDKYAQEAELDYNPPLFIKINAVISTAITVIGTYVMYNAAILTHVSAAEYYAFNVAYGMVMGAFMSVFGIALTAANIKPIFEMAQPILETEPEVTEDKEVITGLAGGIEINNLSFKYDENSPVILDDISLKIKPGQYVAIVGRTGCGKSTLVRLLLGFEKPVRGAIYYDGKDMGSLDLKSLRKNIGVVTQNGKLFSGDIYSNIVVAAPHLTLKDAWEAAEISGIDEDIKKMPMGMYTLISEGGGGISGGQKQRLMIARAVAPKPKVLIFDEATSALDNITQKKVSQALDKMKCTRIVIAHRLSTIRQCDRILVLNEGHIAEDGTYDELVEKQGYFYELVKRQQVENTQD